MIKHEVNAPLQNDDGRCDGCGVLLHVDDCHVTLCASCKQHHDAMDEDTDEHEDVTEILTDGDGVPIPRPCRKDFADDVDFMRAFHAYRDRIADVANTAFVEGFLSEMKR